MKKAGFVLSFVIAIVFLSLTVFADQNVRIVPSDTNMVFYAGESLTTNIVIQNLQNKDDTFSFIVSPRFFGGVTAAEESYLVKVNANSNKSVKIYFSAGMDAEELTVAYNISVKSTIGTAADSQLVYLTTIRKTEVYISDIKLDKYSVEPEQEFSIQTTLTNLAEEASGEYNLRTEIKIGEQVVKRFDDSVMNIPKKSTQTVSNPYKFDKHVAPGTYIVRSTLIDTLNREVSSDSINIKVKEQQNVVQQKSIKYGLISNTIKISVKNNGNVPSDEFFIVASIPKSAESFFYPAIEPSIQKETEDAIIYKWFVTDLQPGEEFTVSYNINTKNLWIVLLIIFGSVILAFKYVFAFTIVKRHSHRGPITKDKEIIVSLDVRNRTRHEIKNVVVKDFVPSIVKVMERFDTVRPKKKKVQGGTELYWKFKSLKPGEERVLTYRVKPVVEIMGALKLPKSHAKYIDKKKEKKLVASKHVVVKPR